VLALNYTTLINPAVMMMVMMMLWICCTTNPQQFLNRSSKWSFSLTPAERVECPLPLTDAKTFAVSIQEQ